MNTRLENLVMSGLVALAVSVSVSGASSPPINTEPIARPALNARLAALQARVDALQNREAMDRQNLKALVPVLNDHADRLDALTECIDSIVALKWDADLHTLVWADPSEEGATPMLSPSDACIEAAA